MFKTSYTNRYRTGLIQIIEALEFGSTNTVHAPMTQALALIKRYKAGSTGVTSRPCWVPL
ncbi:hypothetical protein AB0O34_19705 [Sphaerisporangium sp. NPDC088356]|uniref:hypothetical protein n=1 Tax=Sphaerisporangium sp. NPDC088356 TaxID=3154871 RepID=UPI0034290850